MSDNLLTKMVTDVVDASKPIAKAVAVVEGAVIGAATNDKDAVDGMCEMVDDIYDKIKK